MYNNKIILSLTIVLTILLSYELVDSFNQNSFKFLVAFGSILTVFAPYLIKKYIKFNLWEKPIYFYLIFLLLSQYLGTLNHLYKLDWWDIFVHLYGGAVLVLVGENIIFEWEKSQALQIQAKTIFLFIFSFSIFCGTIWEIYEFLGDQFFSTQMQDGGNLDTMVDLISKFIGALGVALMKCRSYLKNT